MNPEEKLNKHTIFVDDEDQLKDFKPEDHFNTTKELVDHKLLDISPQGLTRPIPVDNESESLKYKYNRLAELN